MLPLDPFSREALLDPYPCRMQPCAMLARLYFSRSIAFTPWRAMPTSIAALLDWQTFCRRVVSGSRILLKEKAWRPKSIVLADGPAAARSYAPGSATVLSPVAMRALRTTFQAQGDAAWLVDALIAKHTFDAVPELAEAYPLEVFPDAVGLRPDGRENLLPFSTMVFNSFGPRNELFHEATAAAAPVLAWIFAQCERDGLAPGGFGAAIWAALRCRRDFSTGGRRSWCAHVDRGARYNGQWLCQCGVWFCGPPGSVGGFAWRI